MRSYVLQRLFKSISPVYSRFSSSISLQSMFFNPAINATICSSPSSFRFFSSDFGNAYDSQGGEREYRHFPQVYGDDVDMIDREEYDRIMLGGTTDQMKYICRNFWRVKGGFTLSDYMDIFNVATDHRLLGTVRTVVSNLAAENMLEGKEEEWTYIFNKIPISSPSYHHGEKTSKGEPLRRLKTWFFHRKGSMDMQYTKEDHKNFIHHMAISHNFVGMQKAMEVYLSTQLGGFDQDLAADFCRTAADTNRNDEVLEFVKQLMGEMPEGVEEDRGLV